jgi:hypothetical protein
MTTNRHPVDELADVRAQIRRLQTREAELRDTILAGTCGLIGDQHEASVRISESERVDVSALRKELGLERLRPFLRATSIKTVRVSEREEPEPA